MYQVVVERQAMKQLAQIAQPSYAKIAEAIGHLAEEPRPHGYIKLKGRSGYRLRVGDYRIIYNIQDNVLTVFVVLIGHRRDVYE